MGGRFSDQRVLGEADLFAPVWQNPNALLFVDVRGIYDDASASEGNFGLGLRHMLDSGWNLGAYGYLDVRRSELDNTFYQTTFGVEALSKNVDFRANAYLPLGDREKRTDAGSWSSVATSGPQAVLTGTSLGIQTQTITSLGTNYLVERAMAGFDAEVGVRLPVFPDDLKLDFRAFAGGYHFEGDGMESITGPRARLELTAHDFAGLPGVRLTGGLIYQSDDVRGDQLIASARLRIPFNVATTAKEKPLTYMEERMVDAVVRDVDIVSNSRAESVTSLSTVTTTTEQAINSWNNELVTSVTSVDGAAGQPGLQAELNARGTGSVVVLNGDVVTAQSVAVNGSQTLLGGGTALKVRGADTGVEVDYVATGGAGSIKGNSTLRPGVFSGLVVLQSKSVVGGVTVESAGNSSVDAAILAHNANGAVAFNNTVFGRDQIFGHGIALESSNNGIIYGNTITTKAFTNTFGIVVRDGSSATIDSNSIYSNHQTSAGVILEAGSAVIERNTFNPYPSGWIIVVNSGTVLPGSTSNVINGSFGTKCNNGGGATGTVEFTDGTSCTFP